MPDNDTERRDGQDERADPHPQISASGLALRNFSSQWFLIPQGTGAIAIILHQLAYQFRGLAIISQCVWVLTILMLASMLLIYLLRAALEPKYVAKQLRTNIMETACLASISVAFTTIIQMTALNLVQTWGTAWGMVVYVLWWINLIMATTGVVGILYVFVGLEASGIDLVPVAIRLPPIAVLTVAAGGGVVCRYGQLSTDLQVPLIILSYLCVGIGVFLALMCDAAFLIRLFDQSWPKGRTMYSIMIACGPYGQSSFAMQILGDVVKRGAFAGTDSSKFIGPGDERIIAACSTLVALLLWGYGTFWWAFACIAIIHDLMYEGKALLRWDKSLGAWSLIFPYVGLSMPQSCWHARLTSFSQGVYANAAIEFGTVLPSKAFDIWSTVLVLLLVILWLFNMIASIIGGVSGKVFGLDRGWRARYTDELSDKDQ